MTPTCEHVHPYWSRICCEELEYHERRCAFADDLFGAEIEFATTLGLAAVLEFGEGERLERKFEKAQCSDEFNCRELFPRTDGAT